MAAMAMVMARATGSAGTSFEARTAGAATAISAAIASAVGTATTAVWTTSAAAITIASATLRALKTGAGIAAADARGLAREVFARCGGSADTRRARFAGEEDDVVFDDGGSAYGGLACVSFD
jgi:hypothetical protein